MRKKEIALLASAAAVAYSLTLLLQAPFQACSGAAAGYYAAGAPETGIKQGKIHETVMPGTPSPACPPTMTTSYTIEVSTVADEDETKPSSIEEGAISRESEEEAAALQKQKSEDDVRPMPGTPSPADYKPPTINDHEPSYEEIDYDAVAIPETYWNNDWTFQDNQQQVSPVIPSEPPKPSTEVSTEPSKETEAPKPTEKETETPSTEAPKETVPSTEASTIAPKNDKPRGGGNHNDRPVPIPTPTVSHPTGPSEYSMEDKVAAAEVVPGNDQAHIHGNSRASASNIQTSRATNTDDTSQMNRNAVAALILLSAFVCYLAYLKSCPRD